MIDWAKVEELRDEIGADDFDEVVQIFLCEVEERVEQLSSHKALTEIEEDLHFLKGSALNLGFTAFASLCHEGERIAQTDQMVANLTDIKNAFLESKGWFLAEFAKRAMA